MPHVSEEQAFIQPVDAENSEKQPSRALVSKNIRIHKRRTSVRLEPAMWNALQEVAGLEGCSVHDLCGAVYDMKEGAMSFTAALRVFLMEYYRSATRADQGVHRIKNHIKARAGGQVLEKGVQKITA